jgi:hypothetical protein
MQYNLRSDFAEDFNTGEDGGGNAGFINCSLPLRFDAQTQLLTVDAASATQPGVITVGAQTIAGPKMIAQTVYPALQISDGVTTASAGVALDTLTLSGPATLDLTTLGPRNNALGDFATYFCRDAIRAPITYPSYGFTVTQIGPGTFAVDAGVLSRLEAPSVAGPCKLPVSIPASGTLADAYPGATITYVYASVSAPHFIQSNTDSNFTNLTDEIALVGAVYKGGTSGTDITNVVTLRRCLDYDFGARVFQFLYATTGAITSFGAFGLDGGLVTASAVQIFAPMMRANPWVILPSQNSWYLLTGIIVGLDRRTFLDDAPTVPVMKYITSDYSGYSAGAAADIPGGQSGAIVFLYDLWLARGYWMLAQAYTPTSAAGDLDLFISYLGRAKKYSGAEHMIVLGVAIGTAAGGMAGADYRKWSGAQPFGAL